MKLLKYIWNFISSKSCYSCKYCVSSRDGLYCKKYKDRQYQTSFSDTCSDYKETEKDF